MANGIRSDLAYRHASASPAVRPPARADGARELLYLSPGGAGRMHALAPLQNLGWSLRRAHDARAALRQLQSSPRLPHAVLIDLREGFEARDLDELGPALAAHNAGWIAGVAAAQLEHEAARRLIRDYCYDYVTLPCPEAVLHTVIGHAYGMAALACGADAHGAPGETGLDGMIGESEPIRALCRGLHKAAGTDAPVFIAGETGTGKELAAMAVHRHSHRARQPFVAINCGAIPHNLVQSELFGYERGAFTGAQQRKLGRIEMAHGGTLFLDEIGDLPLDSQASLLRFLQQGTIERLGGHEQVAVDVRIVSATHHDLDQAVADGKFRADLYHRLCVLRLRQPPLRERGGDIDLLADHALQRYAQETSRGIKGFSPCARLALHRHDWPGNVRELINRVRQAVVMAEGRYLTAADLHIGDAVVGAPMTLDEARDVATREAIERALQRNRGRLGESARELGVSRVTLYRLMQRLAMRGSEEALNEEAQA
ncbi:sigma-54-dependent Fis family transcriptional regulator [Lysobacter sp. K5869]|uniref:sigma-54 dependent transcriptional regulator n=1 Tax=Lysobacter sp. K5869 TaxID=2820808 RepID=UPI001C0635CC|nr:sigma-54 dependent transcriptional regulator [Lysobacter sp. K5869]QWP77726.1 sigma-54-dependent Fis family transcriptional regulator [Lysobacter sp. K5869]